MGPRTLSLAQVIGLIAVVVILVFGVTYASLMLPGLLTPAASPTPGKELPTLQLVVGEADAGSPAEEKKDPEMESGPGQRHFWFQNATDKPVKVWLNNKNCTCSTVKVAVLPADWGRPRDQELDAKVDDPALVWEVIDHDKSVVVPAKGAGGVRLMWNKTKPNPKERFFAELHTATEEAPGSPIRLEAVVNFVEAVRFGTESDLKRPLIDNEISVGNLKPNDEKRTIRLLVWSATRPAFSLKVEEDTQHPCIVWGQPERLSAEKCQELSVKNDVKVLSAYAVPVTIYERSPDGKQFDVGPFRKAVSFTSDALLERVTLRVVGGVSGDVTVGGGDAKDVVQFGTLEVGGPRTKEVVVTSGTPGLKLEVDPDEKLPAYLTARIEEETDSGPGVIGKSWKLSATVLTDKVLGPFPREESVIVLRTNGNPPRKIRIPVLGTVFKK